MISIFSPKQKDIISQGFVEYSKIRVVIGAIFIIASIVAILGAEFSYIQATKEIQSIKSGAIHITPEQFDSANEGKIVYISGFANTDEILRDTQFGVQENALSLKRVVYMYQWSESDIKRRFLRLINLSALFGDNKQYRLSWSEGLNLDQNFSYPQGHENPKSTPYYSQVYRAEHIKIGKFDISAKFEIKTDFHRYELYQRDWESLDGPLKQFFELKDGTYVHGNLVNPSIGDIQVLFRVLKPSTMTVIGRQIGNEIEPLHTSYVNTAFMYYGTVSLGQIFDTVEMKYTLNIWVMRFLIMILICVGLQIGFARNIMVKDTPVLNEMPHFGVVFTVLFRLAPIYMCITAVPLLAFKAKMSIVIMCLFGAIFYIAPRIFLYFEGGPEQPKRPTAQEIGPKPRINPIDKIRSVDTSSKSNDGNS